MLGAVILGMMTVVAPRLGVALMFVCFLAGIIVCSLLLDQFGVLGLPQQPLTLAARSAPVWLSQPFSSFASPERG